MVRVKGLEPPWGKPHTDLNRTRLPIPPHPHVARKTSEKNLTPLQVSVQGIISAILLVCMFRVEKSAIMASCRVMRGIDTRVSPSGKARASQARIRGFESRHPLHSSLGCSPFPAASLVSSRNPEIMGLEPRGSERPEAGVVRRVGVWFRVQLWHSPCKRCRFGGAGRAPRPNRLI